MSSQQPITIMHYLRYVTGVWRADPRSDAELLAQFADAGDEIAFTVLVGRHGNLVWGNCRDVLGDTPDAEDAFQATFMALARAAHRLRREPLAGWLYQASRRAALNQRMAVGRQRQAQARLQESVRPTGLEQVEPATTALRSVEERALIDEELVALPEKLRIPVILYYPRAIASRSHFAAIG